MVIGIDLDEVFFDFVGPFLEFVNKKFGTSYTRADMTDYSFEESGVIPKGTNKKLVHEFGTTGGLRHLPPMPGSVEMVKKLQREHKIVFITSRDQEFENDSLVSLINAGIEKPILCMSSKAKPKSQFVIQHKVDIFLDDSPRFVQDVFLHTHAMVIMVSTIHNAIAKANKSYHIVAANWTDIFKSISAVKQKDPV